MRNGLALAALFAALIGGALPQTALAQEGQRKQITAADLEKEKPTGRFEMEAEQLRLLLGGASGKGVLHFNGKTYPFTMKAVTAGGVGYTKVHAVGDVYFLKTVEDFAGRYSAIGVGATAGGGKGASQFENQKGVLLNVKSKTEGLALNLGVSVAEVQFVK